MNVLGTEPDLEEPDVDLGHQSTWARREIFLSTKFPNNANASKSNFANLTLRKAARAVNLSVFRSSNRSISFYPAAQPKIGNTVCTFSLGKHGKMYWQLTAQVDEVLARWEQVAPSGTALKRRQRITWTDDGRAVLIQLAQNNRYTRAMIAERLNDPAAGTAYRNPGAREFRADDVTRELNRLFPKEMDVQHVLWSLAELAGQERWESLDYKIEMMEIPTGRTLKSLVLTMPDWQELLELYGTTMHVDCTFGVLIYPGYKLMGIAVVDAEGKTRVLAYMVAPGHTMQDWLDLFNKTKGFL